MRETTFDVAADWSPPDLGKLAPDGAIVTARTSELTCTYFDTPSRDLLAAGATLRRRTGQSDQGWQLTVPDGDGGGPLKLRAGLDGAGVPKQLRDLVAGVRSGERLRSWVTITTVRATQSILAADGTVLIELADDRVSATVIEPRRRTVAWRELALEVGRVDADQSLLKRARRLLSDSGATRASFTSKLARALNRPTQDTAPDLSLRGLIGTYVTAQVDALLQRDIDLRRDQDVAHPARVAIRRLRTTLHVFADVFDPARAATLDAELSWFAGLLGQVRDCDVLRVHLHDAVLALPADVVIGPVAERVQATLTTEREVATFAVAKAMRSRRYFAIVRELKAWRDDPAFSNQRNLSGGVGPRLRAVSAKMKLRIRAAERLNPDDPQAADAIHRARRAAKRARYVAELARPRLGTKARTVIAEATALQERLGGQHDSVIAAQFLLRVQRAADAADGESPFTYGVLWAQEHGKVAAGVLPTGAMWAG